MRKNLLAILFALSAIILFVSVWLLFAHEPAYQGKTLDVWLDQYTSNHWNAPNHERDHQAETAIRHFGTNLIPEYLNTISAHPSPFKTRILEHIPPAWRKRFHLPSTKDYEQALDLRRNRGVSGLIGLGADAKIAIPALLSFLNDRNTSVRRCSLLTLGNIGPVTRDAQVADGALPSYLKCLGDPDKAIRICALGGVGTLHTDPGHSIPALVSFLQKDSDPSISRYMAINALGQFETNGTAAVPVLLESLTDSNAEIRRVTILALGKISTRPEVVVPALIESLDRENENPANLRVTFRVLGQYGPKARSALPALYRFTTNSDGNTKKMALSTLKEIDPDDSTATPIK